MHKGSRRNDTGWIWDCLRMHRRCKRDEMSKGCTKDAMERQEDAAGIAGKLHEGCMRGAWGRQEGSRYL